MLFTEAGLEQASRLPVAALHAGRFRAAGVTRVADLGCGIGAEAMSLAALEIKVDAFEIDPVTAAVATYNLAPFENAQVHVADVTELDLESFDGLFFDPARREAGSSAKSAASRRFDPNQFAPPLPWAFDAVGKHPVGIKLGPGHPHEHIPTEAEAQWVSVDGDLVELGLWFNAVARPNIKRSALLLTDAGRHEITSETAEVENAEVGELGEYLYEPDNAVIRSHLIGKLAEQTGTSLISAEIAYLTGNQPLQSPWLRGYRILDNLAFDRKNLRAYLQERGVGVVEIKKRGSDVIPEQLRKELKPRGDNSRTLIITRVAGAHRALIAEPV
jgi:SAM-dependent methyltransferase